jgi:hypothetical protein
MESFHNHPPLCVISLDRKYPFTEKFDLIYHEWSKRNVIQGKGSERVTNAESIKLAKLIGYENTPQFHFLIDLGEEALPYLFLKLKEEKEQFTLPVIEKIMNKKLSPEEVKQHIEEAEKLLNKPEPIAMREWTSRNGSFSIQAQYVSADENHVKLEKENGTIIMVDLSKLSQADSGKKGKTKSSTINSL